MNDTTKINWAEVRDAVVNSMRYCDDAPDSSAYYVRVGNFGRFGSDTRELADRVMEELKSLRRKDPIRWGIVYKGIQERAGEFLAVEE